MEYAKEDERKIIHGHSISSGMNNPSIMQQQAAGVELTGRVTDLNDSPAPTIIRHGQEYFDKKEKVFVRPINSYMGQGEHRITIEDGRSCTFTYAEQHWENVECRPSLKKEVV